MPLTELPTEPQVLGGSGGGNVGFTPNLGGGANHLQVKTACPVISMCLEM